MNAADNGFTVGTYEDLIPTADLVCNLTRQTAYCSSYCYHALDEERIYIILFMVLILWKECKFVKTLLLLCVLQNVLDLKYVRIKEVLEYLL
jgi:hypothetical protein